MDIAGWIPGWVFAAGFIGFGGFLILACILRLRKNKAVKTWPSVEGKVIRSSVVFDQFYEPKVEFEYAVGGVTHKGNDFSNRTHFCNDTAEADKIIAKYPAGERVRVYYDPNFPKDAHLEIEPESKGLMLLFAVLGIGCLGIGVLFLPDWGGWTERLKAYALLLIAVFGFATILIACGSYLIYWVARKWLKDQESRNWPSVEGKVTSSSLIHAKLPVRYWKVPVPIYHMKAQDSRISYEYAVDGRPYSGHRVSNALLKGRRFFDQKKAQKFIEDHAVGKAVRVHFDPDNPEDSVLDPTPASKAALMCLALMGISFVSLGIFGSVMAYFE